MSVSTRALAAAVAAVVILDVIWVRAPFLGFIALPFVIAAWRYREGRAATHIALGLWCALYVLIGVTFALSNGLQGPAEPNLPRETINPGDFAFVYLGTPVAAWLGIRLFGGLGRKARLSREVVPA
jgi:hypothetical protein